MISSLISRRATRAYKNQAGIEILVILLHVLGIIGRRLSFVHGVEVEPGVIVLDGLEVHAHGFLDAVRVLGQL